MNIHFIKQDLQTQKFYIHRCMFEIDSEVLSV